MWVLDYVTATFWKLAQVLRVCEAYHLSARVLKHLAGS